MAVELGIPPEQQQRMTYDQIEQAIEFLDELRHRRAQQAS